MRIDRNERESSVTNVSKEETRLAPITAHEKPFFASALFMISGSGSGTPYKSQNSDSSFPVTLCEFHRKA